MHCSTLESTYPASREKGPASYILMRPKRASALLVLGHGASTNMRHPTLRAIAERLADVEIATLRYNFPYAETGRGRNSDAICMESVRSAIFTAHGAAGDLPILAGGHSFSGRMTSMAAAQRALEPVQGLVFFSFPLHPAGKPAIQRADHLGNVTVPMLFLSGSRDKLADLDLLHPVCRKLGDRATLHVLDTADHGYRVLQRLRQSSDNVFEEMARVVQAWTAMFIA